MSSLLRTLAWTIAVILTPLAAAAADGVAPADLVGLTRDEVIAARGKPSGERARADGSILMIYPDGTKFELRDGRVATAGGAGGGAEIVGADGTRYVPGADGNIQRPVTIVEPAAPAGPEAVAGDAAVSGAPAPTAEDAAGDSLPPGATPPPSVDPAEAMAAGELPDLAQDFGEEDEPEPSAAAKAVGFFIEAVLRFGLVVLVLRIALNVVGVPFLWPDLLKVALLYLAVYEVMSGLASLGGLWEFIALFRLESIVSFLVLACSLTWFKIAGSGLTALKIGVATGAVMYFLMLGIGVAIALVMPSLLL